LQLGDVLGPYSSGEIAQISLIEGNDALIARQERAEHRPAGDLGVLNGRLQTSENLRADLSNLVSASPPGLKFRVF
jgi:hypothetical protein